MFLRAVIGDTAGPLPGPGPVKSLQNCELGLIFMQQFDVLPGTGRGDG